VISLTARGYLLSYSTVQGSRTDALERIYIELYILDVSPDARVATFKSIKCFLWGRKIFYRKKRLDKETVF
jgi:hypothetical protein